jgi:SAM-dependent methyltransferase
MMGAALHRAALTRYLTGSGIEVGPGHVPLVSPRRGLTVRYLDRWEPEINTELFPELAGATFPEPDILVDLNKDALEPVASQSVDFVVCSHVLEHLANPLRVLSDVYRVLRRGGIALILLPDRRMTFDAGREATSLDHVVSEYERGVTEVDDDHVIEFITHVGDPETVRSFERDVSKRPEMLDYQRRRSIHVHCWTFDEFVPLVVYCIEELGNRWEFLDALTTEEQGPGSMEFGLVIRRSVSDLSPSELKEIFVESVTGWASMKKRKADEWRGMLDRLDELSHELESVRVGLEHTRTAVAQRDAAIETANAALSRREHELQALRETRTFRYTSRLRRIYAEMRSMRSSR